MCTISSIPYSSESVCRWVSPKHQSEVLVMGILLWNHGNQMLYFALASVLLVGIQLIAGLTSLKH